MLGHFCVSKVLQMSEWERKTGGKSDGGQNLLGDGWGLFLVSEVFVINFCTALSPSQEVLF